MRTRKAINARLRELSELIRFTQPNMTERAAYRNEIAVLVQLRESL